MSLAVLLDQNVRWEGKGPKAKRILEPPSAEKIKTIRELVAAATGFSEPRGDQLTVDTLPFELTLGLEPPAEPSAPSGPTASPLPAVACEYPGKDAAGSSDRGGSRRRGASDRSHRAAVEAPQTQIRSGRDLAKGAGRRPGGQFRRTTGPRAPPARRSSTPRPAGFEAAPRRDQKSDILGKHLKGAVKADPALSAQLLRTWLNENDG